MRVIKFTSSILDAVYDIQQRAYKSLFDKYHDVETNPYMESRETVLAKYTRAGTDGYVLVVDEIPVGSVRIVRSGDTCKISALAVILEYQNRGIAQSALCEIEGKYGGVRRWVLDTILEEAGNCHLYEKLGYVRVGEYSVTNDRMTIVDYEKSFRRLKCYSDFVGNEIDKWEKIWYNVGCRWGCRVPCCRKVLV